MKNVVIIVVLLLVAVIAHGQAKHAHRQVKEKHYPFPKLYHDVGQFHNGLASAMYDGKYGFIDTGGREVIKCVYDKVGDFEGGFAFVVLDKMEGVIDTIGKIVSPFIYEHIVGNAPWSDRRRPAPLEDHCIVSDSGKYGVFSPLPGNSIPCIYDQLHRYGGHFYKVTVYDKTGLINDSGRIIIPIKYREMTEYVKGAPIGVLESYDRPMCWAFWDTLGNEVVAPNYRRIEQFRSGMGAVEESFKWGCINAKGIEIVPQLYDDPPKFEGDFAVVKVDKKQGVINNRGHVIVPVQYKIPADEFSWSFRDYKDTGLFIVSDSSGLFGVFDSNGTQIIPIEYDKILRFTERKAAFCKNGKWGYFDSRGHVIIEPQFDLVDCFKKGYAHVRKNGKCGLINSKGALKLPFAYGGFEEFSFPDSANSYTIVVRDTEKRYGVVDTNNKVIIPFKYDDIEEFHEGFAAVGKKGRYGFVDLQGVERIPLKYDKGYKDAFHKGSETLSLGDRRITIDTNGNEFLDQDCTKPVNRNSYLEMSDFNEGLAPVKNINSKWGFINRSGKEVIPCQFEDVGLFHNGYARAEIDKGWILINKYGKRVFCSVFDTVEADFHNGYIAVKKNGKFGLMDTKGRIALDFQYTQIGDFNEGWVPVMIEDWAGYVNLIGNRIGVTDWLPPAFYHGIGVIITNDSTIIIDTLGKKISMLNHVTFSANLINRIPFSEGLAVIETNPNPQDEDGFVSSEGVKYLFIDEKGKLPFNDTFDIAAGFKNGTAVVGKLVKKAHRYGIIDKKGRYIIPCIYDAISNFSNNGIAIVQINGRLGFINKLNQLIIPNIYDDVLGWSDGKNILYRVKKNDEWGYINKSGKRVLWFK